MNLISRDVEAAHQRLRQLVDRLGPVEVVRRVEQWEADRQAFVAPITETCARCRFYLGTQPEVGEPRPMGGCRRYPPRWTGGATNPTFPAVLASNWCGEYQPS